MQQQDMEGQKKDSYGSAVRLKELEQPSEEDDIYDFA